MVNTIWNWAETYNVEVKLIIEEGSDFKIYCKDVHFSDLEMLNKIEGWHVAFVEPDTKHRICILLYKD